MRRDAQGGYALVAAVACIAVFAAIALALVSAIRTATDDASGELARLRAVAAADAGFALAVSRLMSPSAGGFWPADGRVHVLRYRDARIEVRCEDERGKVPLNGLTEAVATRLLEAAGLDGDRLLIARDSVLDWEDDDEQPRPFGAERGYYAATGIAPANGPLQAIDELRRVRGFDAGTIDRLRALATVYVAPEAFDPRVASPTALTVMEAAGGKAAVAAIDRARERSGQRTAIAFTDISERVGRPVSLRVEAELRDGARAVRRNVVILTGEATMPYIVVAAD